jgi:hypothetical protein
MNEAILCSEQPCVYCKAPINSGTKVLSDGWLIVLHLRPSQCNPKFRYTQKNKEYEDSWYKEYESRKGYYEKSAKKEWKIHNKSSYSKLYLLNNAPVEVVKAAYLALSKIYHPDSGGNEEKMKEINSAFDEIMKGK